MDGPGRGARCAPVHERHRHRRGRPHAVAPRRLCRQQRRRDPAPDRRRGAGGAAGAGRQGSSRRSHCDPGAVHHRRRHPPSGRAARPARGTGPRAAPRADPRQQPAGLSVENVLQELAALTAWYAYIACLIYLTVVFAVMATTAVLAALENRFRARETRLEDFDTLLASPFTIPVSIVVPAYNEEVAIQAVVVALLALDYPEYGGIVVDDGSTDGTLARLREQFALQTTGSFYRRTIATSPVTHMFSSAREPRLTVISKTNGGKGDALNCGVNVARYRYVCCVDGDTMYEPDALLKGMRLVVQDPARVIGVTSRVAVGRQPERLGGVDATQSRIDRNPLVVFQSFDYLRAFVNVRAAWSRSNYMLCASGAFAIWRRDVLLQLGGFSPLFSCEDLEFTFRAHEHFRAARIPYRILALADAVGVTEAPTNISGLVRQRARWQ